MSTSIDERIDKAFKKRADENLDKLLDDIINKKILQEKTSRNPMQKRRKELKLSLPLMHMNENFGQDGTIERSELEQIVKTATKGAKDIFEKLSMLNLQMKRVREGLQFEEGEIIYNPAKYIAQIMLMETMNRMFRAFQASPAGFVNEGFTSVFYDGMQVDATTGNREYNIGDIMAPEEGSPSGIPISLKTKAGDYSAEGSVRNLYESINNYGKVYFDIFAKESSGQEVNSMVLYRFVVDKDNINDFLGQSTGGKINHDYFDISEDGKLVPSTGRKSGNTPWAKSQRGRMANVVKELAAENVEKSQEFFFGLYEEIEQMSVKRWNQSIDSYAERIEHFMMNTILPDLLRMKKGYYGDKVILAHQEYQRSILEILNTYYEENETNLGITNARKLSDLYNLFSKATAKNEEVMKHSFGKKVKRGSGDYLGHFHLSFKKWMPFHVATGPKPVRLEFSSENIRETLAVLIEHMHDSMIKLVNDVEMLATTFNQYVTSPDSSKRNKLGTEAVNISKRIKPETEKAVGLSKNNPKK